MYVIIFVVYYGLGNYPTTLYNQSDCNALCDHGMWNTTTSTGVSVFVLTLQNSADGVHNLISYSFFFLPCHSGHHKERNKYGLMETNNTQYCVFLCVGYCDCVTPSTIVLFL